MNEFYQVSVKFPVVSAPTWTEIPSKPFITLSSDLSVVADALTVNFPVTDWNNITNKPFLTYIVSDMFVDNNNALRVYYPTYTYTSTQRTEGTNLYYTNARFDTSFGAKINNDFIVGAAKIGNYNTTDINHAVFHHKNLSSTLQYALLQHSSGFTYLNCTNGTEIHFRKNNVTEMVLTGGNLGIGTTNPTKRLHVEGSVKTSSIVSLTNAFLFEGNSASTYIYMSGTTNRVTFKNGSTTKAFIDSDGNLWEAISDIRFEKNIQPYKSDIEKFKKVQIVKYDRTDDETIQNQIGFKAQDLKNDYPECVDNIQTEECDDFHFVKPERMIFHLISVVQQLTKKIEFLEAKIENK